MSTKAEIEFEGYSGPFGQWFLTMTIGSEKVPNIKCFERGFFSRACQAMTEGLQYLDKYQLSPPRLTKEEQAVLSACIAYCRCNCWETSSKLSKAASDYTLSVKK